MNRRSALVGMGGLGLTAGCAGAALPRVARAPAAIDLSAIEELTGGRLGMAALDLTTGRGIAWRGSERFAFCSTFKLFVAAATLERVDGGEERLDRAVPIAAADMVSHAPTTQPAVGSTLSIEALCKGAVEVSDNPAANLLIDAMGGLPAFQAWYRELGDPSTRVDRREPALNEVAVNDERDTALPLQTVSNLQAALVGNRLAPTSRARLNRWLEQSPTGPNRIRAGAPAGWTVRHKTGTWNGDPGLNATNDVGLLLGPSGGAVLIALYLNRSAAPLPQQEAALAQATRLALARFGHG